MPFASALAPRTPAPKEPGNGHVDTEWVDPVFATQMHWANAACHGVLAFPILPARHCLGRMSTFTDSHLITRVIIIAGLE